MKESDRLLRILYSEHEALLKAIADAFEDEGDTVTALGMRWLIEHKKMPYRNHQGEWTWRRGRSRTTTNTLPAIPDHKTRSSTMWRAYWAGAGCVGTWLVRYGHLINHGAAQEAESPETTQEARSPAEEA